MDKHKHDPLRELNEIRNQLSYSKRIGFLFGAGTSKAMGIPDIGELTKRVEAKVNGELKSKFDIIKNGLDNDVQHIEAILNQIRLIRQITSDSIEKSFDNVSGDDSKKLDKTICNEIYSIISDEEAKADINVAKRFIGWLNWLSRDFPKEIFTTNYDLILENQLKTF